ncbi:MAG: YdcF family protein [Patescibacteria group bacterium]
MEDNIKKITQYIFLESKPCKADLVFIFGTRHKEALNKFLELYSQGLVQKVIVSGGINKVTGQNEAEAMASFLIDKGVPKEDIMVENQSSNSLENVLLSRKIIEKKTSYSNLKKILVIVKHYHSRRALMTLKKHFPKTVKFIPVTYEVYGFSRENWSTTKLGKEKVMSEYQKVKEYLKQGDLEEL